MGGYYDLHKKLECKIAKLHNQEDALLFTSGYAANIGVFQNLFNKEDIVFVDMFVHASIYDGLNGSANTKIFKHNDIDYLEMCLKRELGKFRNMVIVVDGVFSQDGDLANLPDICYVAKRYGAKVFVDDAHGVGVMGKNGSGTVNHFNIEKDVDLITGTLSKGLGSSGGYIAGKKELITYLRHYARSNTFSASISPSAVAAASKAIELLSDETNYIKQLWDNTYYI